MRIEFLEVARREFDDAVAWYNGEQDGVGLEFLDEIDRAALRLSWEPGTSQFLQAWRIPAGARLQRTVEEPQSVART